MKKYCALLTLLFLPVIMTPCIHAASFGTTAGCLTTADACGFGSGYIGGFAGYGDEASTIFGNISYGFSNYTEGRVLIGFSDPDFSNADPSLLLGADVKYEVMDYYDKLRENPFDMALGAFIELVNYEGFSTLELGPYAIGSIPYRFSSGRKIIPYSRLNLRWERISFDENDDANDSNFRLGLNLGVKFELAGDINLYGEIQIDGNTGIFAGVDFKAF